MTPDQFGAPVPPMPAVPPMPPGRPVVGRDRRRRWAWLGVVLLVVGVPSGWYFGGGYDRWQDGRSLQGLCGGTLDTAEVKDLLDGAGRLRGYEISPVGWLANCGLTTPDRYGSLLVDVAWDTPRAYDALFKLRRTRVVRAEGVPVVPVGAGWAGVMSAGGDGREHLVLALACTGKEAGRQLVVSLTADPTRDPDGPKDDFASAEQRARLGRIGARTAQRANDIWGCGAQLGGKIEQVPGRADIVTAQPGKATGTCAGVAGQVRESPADGTAPIEDCAVLMPDDPKTVGLRLSAYYPPFDLQAKDGVGLARGSNEPGVDGSLSWATAKCPGGTAVYLGNRLEPTTASARDALAAFARHSAERHGCSAPALP
ncbi:hypothetical protein ACFV4P_22570 [Kitasatospora sp. NPDC059795]|uniref:hypothetical protein n=1 Tax=Kitasatospora sp. NPDC059795 TaxID=3346949 RepID=UPI00364F77E9